jgi:hypothetical protein
MLPSSRAAPCHRNRRQWLRLLTTLGLAHVTSLAAQPMQPELVGSTPDGRRFRLSEQVGRVVMVFYWSTDCAVCRDKMGELRANLGGWARQPFTLIGVNMDRRLQDFRVHEDLVRQTIAPGRRFDSLWAAQPGFIDTLGAPTRLPEACLIDKQGRLVERYSGRIPAQAWDRIAELL